MPVDGITLQALRTARQCIAVGHYDAAIKCLRDSGEYDMASQLSASYATYKANKSPLAAAASAAVAAVSSTAAATSANDTAAAAVEVALAQAVHDFTPSTVNSSAQIAETNRLMQLG
jgi:hypothetical protein